MLECHVNELIHGRRTCLMKAESIEISFVCLYSYGVWTLEVNL